MKKKAIIAAVAVILTVAAAVAIVCFVLPYFDSVTVHVPLISSREGSYLITPNVSGSSNTSSSKQENIREFLKTITEFSESFREENKDNVYKIDCKVKIEWNATTVIFYGTVTDSETGKTIDYLKEIEFDFCISGKYIGKTLTESFSSYV